MTQENLPPGSSYILTRVSLTGLELCVDQANLELRDLLASASQVLRLKVCSTMPSPRQFFWFGLVWFLRQGFFV